MSKLHILLMASSDAEEETTHEKRAVEGTEP